MDALALLEDLANDALRRERVFRDREDFLAHDDDWLMSRFRFPRAILLELCSELRPVLERPSRRNRAVCSSTSGVVFLSYFLFAYE